jgi:hypothetical protein
MLSTARLWGKNGFNVDREEVIHVKVFLTIAFVVAILFGIAFVIAPSGVAATYGIKANPEFILAGRFFGSVLIGIALVLWFARNFKEWNAVRGVLIAHTKGRQSSNNLWSKSSSWRPTSFQAHSQMLPTSETGRA